MTQTILREGGREGGRDELRTESDMEEAHLSILGRFFTFLPLAISLSLGLWLGLRSSVSSLGTDPKTLHLLLDTLYWSAHVSWFYDVSKFPVVLPIILWRIRKYEGLTYNMGGGGRRGGEAITHRSGGWWYGKTSYLRSPHQTWTPQPPPQRGGRL